MKTGAVTGVLVLAFCLLAGCAASGSDTSDKVVNRPDANVQLRQIILLPNGLSDGVDHPFHYGADKGQLTIFLQRFGPVDQNTNEECGAGPIEFLTLSSAGLTLNFQQGKLVGWFLDRDGTTAGTRDGITIGSKRADLEKVMKIEMQPDSTLGVEFYSPDSNGGFIAGFLTGQGPGAQVDSLYAGTNCFFR